ncbi:expressed unknown protein [Seminavis robusta]|uniref:Uncharacterized protein n=1 Tax=Seminavis robusta TaxID=568900 RepID=A0A9N8HS12_9STRA|nr:expressed unknown protein [Seminavis robusta]|eukprot:Sro1381_g267880.1 n/a (214) ;mRNA; r:25595-26236
MSKEVFYGQLPSNQNIAESVGGHKEQMLYSTIISAMLSDQVSTTSSHESIESDEEPDDVGLDQEFGGDDEEDSMLHDGFWIETDNDVESYNRWFLQQQQLRQERGREEQMLKAKQRRQRIAQAILGGIHLTTSEGMSKESGQVPVFSVLRSPEWGTITLKVPLGGERRGITERSRTLLEHATSTKQDQEKSISQQSRVHTTPLKSSVVMAQGA